MKTVLPFLGITGTTYSIGLISLALGASLLVCAGQASAQAPKKAKPGTRPPAQAISKPSGPIIMGTTQLPGDFGEVGTTYTVGKSDPLNFTLQSASYSIAPLVIGEHVWVPTTGQKLLLLNYTDWYDTQTGKMQNVQARSVVAGLFLPLLARKWGALRW